MTDAATDIAEGGLRLNPVALPSIADGPLAELRRAAAARFAETGAPGPKLERWKYTNLQPLTKTEFRVAGGRRIDAAMLPEIPGTLRMVFVDGRHAPGFANRLDAVAGLASLSDIEADMLPSLVAPQGTHADMALATLNTALAEDGYVLDVPGGETVPMPLHIVHVGTGGVAANLRNIIRLGAGAQATIIETWMGEAAEYWVNAVTDIELAEGAALTHYKWQRESTAGFHTALVNATLAEGARYDALALAAGSRLARQEFAIALAGEKADCRLRGVSLGKASQHLDTTVTMDHRSPNAHSEQLFKAVLAKKGRSVFQGLVKVARGADGTDAHQKSNNLLLDRSAEADAKPELEIFADDVACSHGATVGELDEDKVFYLMSRGLSEAAAKALLVEGFVSEIVDEVADEEIATYLHEGAQSAARNLTEELQA